VTIGEERLCMDSGTYSDQQYDKSHKNFEIKDGEIFSLESYIIKECCFRASRIQKYSTPDWSTIMRREIPQNQGSSEGPAAEDS